MNEIDVVRIVRLDPDISSRVDQQCSTRDPAVGDEGTVMTVIGNGKACLAESVQVGGPTDWLATLRNHEIEIICKFKK